MIRNTWHRALVQLGRWFRGELEGLGPHDTSLLTAAESANRWFSQDYITQSMEAYGEMLLPDNLTQWLANYPGLRPADRSPLRVGLILAGNLPLVGWHDVLCVLLAGHHPVIKCATSDRILIPAALAFLREVVEDENQKIWTLTSGTLSGFDAVIATGSNNTKRYFNHYFNKIPHIIRGQRTSVAFLDGNETEEECYQLGHDVFDFYGLGCRSVTKLFLPRGFDLNRLFGPWVHWSQHGMHNKYANNYDYHKAIWLLNQEDLLENGFLLMKEDQQWFSPVGTLFYEWYDDAEAIKSRVNASQIDLQCIVIRTKGDVMGWEVPKVNMGQSQHPAPWDYADGVDTMKFLMDLSLSHETKDK